MSSLWFAHLTHVFSELTTNLTRQEKGVLPTIICFCYFLWIAFCKIKGFKLWLAILSSGQIEMSKRKTRCTFHWTFLDALASLRPMMERLFQTTKYYKSKCLKDREWQYLTIFGSIWQYLETFGNIWQYLAIFGNIICDLLVSNCILQWSVPWMKTARRWSTTYQRHHPQSLHNQWFHSVRVGAILQHLKRP